MRSLSEILKSPIRIPGIKPRPRVKRAPWVLRHCPENKRNFVEKGFILAGLVAKLILFVAGLMGIFVAPLLLAAAHPDAPVAIPIRWLRAHFSHDTGFFIYTVIWGIFVGVLTYAIIVFDYVMQHRKRPDETPQPNKSDAV